MPESLVPNSTAAPRGQRAKHAIIVGGGVIGVCCAYFLARRGIEVTVLERNDIGRGASYGNAGLIAPGHVPINKPGRVRQALKSLLDPLSPLYVAPRLDPALASWLWTFTQACTEKHLDFSMRSLGSLGHATSRLFDDLMEEEKLECGYRREGYYEAYLTERGLESGRKEARQAQRYGHQTEVLSGEALREREPSLNSHILGGVFYPSAATLNPYRFVRSLAERARRHGAVFRTSTEVVDLLMANEGIRGVRTAGGEILSSNVVVLAQGAYGAHFVRRLGLRFPLQAGKGYHRDCRPEEGKIPMLRNACALAEKSVFCTPMDGFLRFAGTLEFSGINDEIRRPRLEQLTNAAKLYLNGIGGVEPISEWCGLRPCMPDGLPVVGPVPGRSGLFIATGHAMLGLTLGPITGKLVAEYVVDGAPSLDLTALRPERF
jgi:D-amino-acid dehydrogenase